MATKREVITKLQELTVLVNELPNDVVKPPVEATDDQLAAIIRTEFLKRTIPNGYTATTGFPGASTPMGETNTAMQSWVRLLRETMAQGGDVTTIYPRIDADVAKYFAKKTEPPVVVPPTQPPVTPPANGNDEVLTKALIMSRSTGGHEVIPDTADVSPSWGIIIHGQMDESTNPGPQWPAYPPHLSDNQRIMGWAVFDGIQGRQTTSENTAIQLVKAVVGVMLNDGTTQVVTGYNMGQLTLDLGMVYDGTQVPTVGDRLVAGIGRRDRPWHQRNWHPTFNELTPRGGGQLRSKVRTCVVGFAFKLVPIDPAKPFDHDKYQACAYGGEDNYGGGDREDGMSGKFIKVQPWLRWNGKWRGRESDIDAIVAAMNAAR